jgi:hypothetical protein
MKRMWIGLSLGVLAVSSAGCGCCSWCLPRPAPVAACPPACPPPAPVCDPCATAPVTYGGPPPAVVPYTPPPQW